MSDDVGWNGLRELTQPVDDDKRIARDDLDRLYLRVFNSRDGKKVLMHLREQTIEQPTWYPGEDASHGFAREGQNSIVREIERRIERARNL